MDTSSVGHFAALSFIVAPAMLTNATAFMGVRWKESGRASRSSLPQVTKSKIFWDLV